MNFSCITCCFTGFHIRFIRFQNIITVVFRNHGELVWMSVGVACDRAASVAGSTVRGPIVWGWNGTVKRTTFLYETSSEEQKQSLPETNFFRPWKWMVGRWISFWDGLFSGAMFRFREGNRGINKHPIFCWRMDQVGEWLWFWFACR